MECGRKGRKTAKTARSVGFLNAHALLLCDQTSRISGMGSMNSEQISADSALQVLEQGVSSGSTNDKALLVGRLCGLCSQPCARKDAGEDGSGGREGGEGGEGSNSRAHRAKTRSLLPLSRYTTKTSTAYY